MPTPASELQTRYQSLVAPGNNALFWRLLTEANERLLFSGRWHWAREPLSLAVVDGAITLPDGYHSIVGARINGTAVGVNWQESEWFEGGPGEFIPIEGARAFLVDQGLSELATITVTGMTVAGDLTDGVDDLAIPELAPGDDLNDHPVFINGFSSITYNADAGGYILEHSPDEGVTYFTWSAIGDWASPELATGWTADSPATGTPELTLISTRVVTYERVFKLTSANADIETVDVLARFKPSAITSGTDEVICPLPSAIKQMLYSIVYEEANNTDLSEQYRTKALREIAEHESAYRGTAKRIFKPNMFRPIRRCSRSNFP